MTIPGTILKITDGVSETGFHQGMAALLLSAVLVAVAGCDSNTDGSADNAASSAASGNPSATEAALLADPILTTHGLVSGMDSPIVDGVRIFKGIPFAAPPVGDLRWQPPRPVTAWEGVRAADTFSPACMQAHQTERFPGNVSVDLPDSPSMSEDCLYLNVWTPATEADEKLPVMLWIFGGAYTEGAGSTPHNNGDHLAAKGVIVVTFNYRLGALGFLAHPELTAESEHGASGNYGLADTLAALQWIQDNIDAFGGDAGNVTIFGESAGSAMATALVGSPVAKGLFHKAIAQSGTWMGLNMGAMTTRESAEARIIQAAEALDMASLADLRALPAADAIGKLPGQGLIVDGWIVPEDLTLTFNEGRQNAVDVIAGSNRDEGSFTAASGHQATAVQWEMGAAQRWGQLADQGLKAYPPASDASAREHSSKTFTDNMAYMMRQFGLFQDSIGRNAWVYHFVQAPPYPEDVRDLGVCHACEITYVFNNLGAPRVYPDSSSPQMALASEADRRTADIASSYWVNFARTGNPNGEGLPQWPRYSAETGSPILHIDASPQTGDSLGEEKKALYHRMYDRLLENLQNPGQ